MLDAAEQLYYARGIQSVGMDEVRDTAGVSLARLYRLFPSKQHLVAAYLRRRDERWRASLARYVSERAVEHGADRRGRLLSVFDWLAEWFREPDFRGCAFANAFGELGAGSGPVADAVREHKALVRRYLVELADDPPRADSTEIADQLLLLLEGATTTAAITGSPDPARTARAAAAALLAAKPA
nr:TetR/AcrR family transcriptional regulator [Planosporangium thailandense]